MAVVATTSPDQPKRQPRFNWRMLLIIAGTLFLLFFAFVEIAPFVLTIANSFKCQSAVQNAPGAIVPVPPFGASCFNDAGDRRPYTDMVDGATFNPTWLGYQTVFNEDLPRWLFNTIFLSTAITILRLIFDSMAGYALARLKFPGNRLMFLMILGTLMIPGVVLIIPRFIILKQLGMLNSYQGFIITLAVDAFGIFLMKQFFEAIPAEIEEAAQVDGASRFTIFFRIVLPMATPALTALTIFSFQGQWNNFMDALIILGGNKDLYNLPLGLSVLRGAGDAIQFERVLPGSVITTIPMAIIFFIFQRYFVEGISYSGLKG
ncbi:MAG TPA: carbohydrate ABC transporter permease [Phototrophicaceae bacterium]|jgi:multiple sugar transport system permease protein|nr:carbohydrate ABC transporter permease [Phototrophicaceae bacterium]